MKVRPYTDGDMSEVLRLHKEANLDYQLPPMRAFFSKSIAYDDTGIGAVVLVQKTAEVFLICNPNWKTPAFRLDAIERLNHVAHRDAKIEGIQEAFSFVPPPVELRFGKRLIDMGWQRCRPEWVVYWRQVQES